MARLIIPFAPRIGGGGVVTVIADPGQFLYWELVSYDPLTDTEGEALGSLKWDHTRTDASGLCCNIYLAPTDPGLAGLTDRIKLRWADA